jgi:hypothetical protein
MARLLPRACWSRTPLRRSATRPQQPANTRPQLLDRETGAASSPGHFGTMRRKERRGRVVPPSFPPAIPSARARDRERVRRSRLVQVPTASRQRRLTLPTAGSLTRTRVRGVEGARRSWWVPPAEQHRASSPSPAGLPLVTRARVRRGEDACAPSWVDTRAGTMQSTFSSPGAPSRVRECAGDRVHVCAGPVRPSVSASSRSPSPPAPPLARRRVRVRGRGACASAASPRREPGFGQRGF